MESYLKGKLVIMSQIVVVNNIRGPNHRVRNNSLSFTYMFFSLDITATTIAAIDQQ